MTEFTKEDFPSEKVEISIENWETIYLLFNEVIYGRENEFTADDIINVVLGAGLQTMYDHPEVDWAGTWFGRPLKPEGKDNVEKK